MRTVTQRDLAGYLNVTETTISRISKRLRQEITTGRAGEASVAVG